MVLMMLMMFEQDGGGNSAVDMKAVVFDDGDGYNGDVDDENVVDGADVDDDRYHNYASNVDDTDDEKPKSLKHIQIHYYPLPDNYRMYRRAGGCGVRVGLFVQYLATGLLPRGEVHGRRHPDV